MRPKDTDRMANSFDPDQTVCPDLSAQKLRIITVQARWQFVLTLYRNALIHDSILSFINTSVICLLCSLYFIHAHNYPLICIFLYSLLTNKVPFFHLFEWFRRQR